MWIKYKVPFIIFGVAFFLLVVGLTIGSLWTLLFNKILISKLVLSETSKSFDMWKETPIPMYLKVYFFNWTNPEEFIKGTDAKPNFVEMGPYVFKEVDYKIPLKWNNNDTFTFHQKRVWHFVPSSTVGSLDDNVTNLNPVAATVAHSFSGLPKFVKGFINRFMLILNETLVIRKTVRELLFEGYDDKMLKYAKTMEATKLPYSKFGWFYGRNESETYDGTFNMLRGENNIHELGMVKEWNYSNKTQFYNGDCGKIRGVIGDLWPPLKNNKTVSIFAPDICTALSLKFDNTSDHLGLIGYRYISDERMLDNGSKVPSRKCYCHKDKCQPSGTLNVSKCKYDAPIFVSLPHFYLADESYRTGISGMRPNKTEHEFYITIEPKTGIPMQVKAQLQINMLIQPDNEYVLFKNIKKTYVPMLWFTQEAYLTPEFAEEVKLVMILPMLGHVTFFGIGGLGFFLVIIAASIFIRTKRNNEDRQVLIKD